MAGMLAPAMAGAGSHGEEGSATSLWQPTDVSRPVRLLRAKVTRVSLPPAAT
jgi:hypothetical protein